MKLKSALISSGFHILFFIFLGTPWILVGQPDDCDNDTIDPIWQVADEMDNIVVDNNPFTVPGTTANLGTIEIPPGECPFRTVYTATGFDLCDGSIMANDAVSVSVTPGTEFILYNDGVGNYMIDITWGQGAQQVEIIGMDMAGNEVTLVILATVMGGEDTIDPIWQVEDEMDNIVVDNNPFTVPGTTANLGTIEIPPGGCPFRTLYTATGFDLCDGSIKADDAVSVSVTPGTEFILYNDGMGNYMIDITWGQGAQQIDIVGRDYAGNEVTLVILATVMGGEDTIDPIWQVADEMDNIVVDNNPFTVPGTTANLGTIEIPPGGCPFRTVYTATGFDLCDGSIMANDAVSVSVTPGTEFILYNDGMGNYMIDITWGQGAQQVEIIGMDMAGNEVTLVILATVMGGEDTIDPIWQVVDEMDNIVVDNNPFTVPGTTANLGTIEIPPGGCPFRTVYTATGFDLCDGSIRADNAVSVSVTPGTEFILYNDGMGNYMIDITWGQGAQQIDIVGMDLAGNEVTLIILATVMSGEDDNDPVWQVVDEMDNVVVDNNPFTVPGTVANLGTVVLEPENCTFTSTFIASGFDLCDGIITAEDALSVVPSGDAEVSVSSDGSGQYIIEVLWGYEEESISIIGKDFSGNEIALTISLTIVPCFIPTLNQWGIIILGLILTILSLVAIHQKKQAEQLSSE